MKKPESDGTTIISEKTLLPISLIIVLIAGIVRVETTTFKANASEEKIKSLESEIREMSRGIGEVQKALARIEGKLETNKQLQEHTDESPKPSTSYRTN